MQGGIVGWWVGGLVGKWVGGLVGQWDSGTVAQGRAYCYPLTADSSEGIGRVQGMCDLVACEQMGP